MVIVRKGAEAKGFDAPKVFSDYFWAWNNIKQKKRTPRIDENTRNLTNKKKKRRPLLLDCNTSLPKLEKVKAGTTMKKPWPNGLFRNGTLETSMPKLLKNWSSERTKTPSRCLPAASCRCKSQAAMIEGFKEGLRLLKVGDEATLFLPYNIAYLKQIGREFLPCFTS